jgi:Holliday junction resolvasome RuvABC endonuclease subunit
VLSAYVNTRGFAFVLFEGSALSPFDWGIQEVRGPRRQHRCLSSVVAIMDRYRPDILVIQDTSASGTRRALRLVRLNAAIAGLAEDRGTPVYAYSRADVYDAFQYLGFSNKQTLAELIAKHIPAFERYVPPPRKPWMSEDARMGVFDAAALALVFFQREGGPERHAS